MSFFAKFTKNFKGMRWDYLRSTGLQASLLNEKTYFQKAPIFTMKNRIFQGRKLGIGVTALLAMPIATFGTIQLMLIEKDCTILPTGLMKNQKYLRYSRYVHIPY